MLREFYLDTYYESIDDNTDVALGAVCNRICIEPIVEDAIDASIAEYTQLEVKEYLGLTYPEYMNTNPLIRSRYIKYLEPIAEAKSKQLAELKAAGEEIGDVDG